jgi:hypothetical protein
VHRIADTTPPLSQFHQLVRQDVGPLVDGHTKGAVTRLTSRRYAEDMAVQREAEARERQAQQERSQREATAFQLIYIVRSVEELGALSEIELAALVKDCREFHGLTAVELVEAQQLLDFMPNIMSNEEGGTWPLLPANTWKTHITRT